MTLGSRIAGILFCLAGPTATWVVDMSGVEFQVQVLAAARIAGWRESNRETEQLRVSE